MCAGDLDLERLEREVLRLPRPGDRDLERRRPEVDAELLSWRREKDLMRKLNDDGMDNVDTRARLYTF